MFRTNAVARRDYLSKTTERYHLSKDDAIEIETSHRYVLLSKTLYHKNRIHKNGEPAIMVYYATGEKRMEKWYQHGQYHRVGGPAETYWNKQGKVVYLGYIQRNHTHRDDGPAIQSFEPPIRQEWALGNHGVADFFAFLGTSLDAQWAALETYAQSHKYRDRCLRLLAKYVIKDRALREHILCLV